MNARVQSHVAARLSFRLTLASGGPSGTDGVCLVDEPTSALDVSIQKQVLDLLQDLQARRGLSYLLITHDVAVVRAMAHTVLVMKDGAVMEAGSVDDVLTRPREAYTRELVEGAE